MQISELIHPSNIEINPPKVNSAAKPVCPIFKETCGSLRKWHAQEVNGTRSRFFDSREQLISTIAQDLLGKVEPAAIEQHLNHCSHGPPHPPCQQLLDWNTVELTGGFLKPVDLCGKIRLSLHGLRKSPRVYKQQQLLRIMNKSFRCHTMGIPPEQIKLHLDQCRRSFAGGTCASLFRELVTDTDTGSAGAYPNRQSQTSN